MKKGLLRAVAVLPIFVARLSLGTAVAQQVPTDPSSRADDDPVLRHDELFSALERLNDAADDADRAKAVSLGCNQDDPRDCLWRQYNEIQTATSVSEGSATFSSIEDGDEGYEVGRLIYNETAKRRGWDRIPDTPTPEEAAKSALLDWLGVYNPWSAEKRAKAEAFWVDQERKQEDEANDQKVRAERGQSRMGLEHIGEVPCDKC